MLKSIYLISLLLVTSQVFAADDFNRAFQNGLDTSVLHQNQAQDALGNFDPKLTFKNYCEMPSQSNYYQGVDQAETNLKTDAVIASNTDESYQSIQESVIERPSFKIDHDSPEMKKSEFIQGDAVNIAKGISDQFVDCTKQQSCIITYETKTCEESPSSLNQFCKKLLNIEIIPHTVEVHYKLNAYLAVADHNYAGVVVNTVTGGIGFLGPHDASFRLDGRLPTNIDCRTLQGKIIATSGDAAIDSVNLPTCSNGLVLDYHISGGHSRNLTIDIVSTKIEYEFKDHWDDQCIALANNRNCTFQHENCVQPKATRTIQDTPITRDCWEKEAAYLCNGGGTQSNTCQPLREKGCEQIGSQCLNKTDGGCMLYQQTFRCPIKKCTDIGAICNGETYCLTDDCVKHDKKADPDFQKAVSALSATSDAAHQFDQQFVFRGNSKNCSLAPIGFLNCCTDSGWGEDIHLAQCSDEEKALGKAKENGLVIYVGEYCAKEVMGVCTSKRKSYCVFPSKLARIVQQQGRSGQLQINFGDGDAPDCRGLTPEELQKIDFGKIDFTEFYEDITQKEKVSDKDKVNQEMQQRIKDLIQQGKPHV